MHAQNELHECNYASDDQDPRIYEHDFSYCVCTQILPLNIAINKKECACVNLDQYYTPKIASYEFDVLLWNDGLFMR